MGILGLEFMRRALVAAVLVGVTAPSIGVFLVQRRLSLMGDGIGHVAFMGVAGGLFIGASPVITGIAAASVAGISMEYLRGKGRLAGDVALALIFYGGIAGGAVLTYLSGQANRVLGYLFGSVLTVDNQDLAILAVASVTVLVATTLWRRELFALCYDEEVAKASGLPVRRLNLMLALAAALTVGVTMRVVGILLVSAMLVLPVAAVQQLTTSFRQTVIWSMVAGAALSAGGLLVAFYANTSPGATIVLCAIAAFLVTGALSRMRRPGIPAPQPTA
jgi:zinc transport system permease protein